MTYQPSGPEEEQFLKEFDPSQYKNPAVAADTALFAVDGDTVKVLLIRRGGFPYKGSWALPGGFVNIDEELRDSAARELMEETGLSGLYLEQAFVWGQVGRDPRQRVLTVSYIALADFATLDAQAGDDAAEAGWFTLSGWQKKESDGNVCISYKLSGKEELCPSVIFPKGRMQEIARAHSGGLAFDHAESIAYAFMCLKQRIQHGAFLDMSFTDAHMKARAKKAIFAV